MNNDTKLISLLKENKHLKNEISIILWNECVPYHPKTKEIPKEIKITETENQIGDYKINDVLGIGNFATIK